jgi:hypothetical protein
MQAPAFPEGATYCYSYILLQGSSQLSLLWRIKSTSLEHQHAILHQHQGQGRGNSCHDAKGTLSSAGDKDVLYEHIASL